MPTTFNFDSTIRAFRTRSSITAWECTGELEAGEWSWSERENERPIAAIVHNPKRVEQNIEGAGLFDESRINIITKSFLYYTARGTDKQTWISYMGKTYKIVGEGLMSDANLVGNAAYHTYNAVQELT